MILNDIIKNTIFKYLNKSLIVNIQKRQIVLKPRATVHYVMH